MYVDMSMKQCVYSTVYMNIVLVAANPCMWVHTCPVSPCPLTDTRLHVQHVQHNNIH